MKTLNKGQLKTTEIRLTHSTIAAELILPQILNIKLVVDIKIASAKKAIGYELFLFISKSS